MNALTVLLFFLILCHCSACGWYYVGVTLSDTRDTWATQPLSESDLSTVLDKSWRFRYFICAYWTLNQIGFGRSSVEPTNSYEFSYALIVSFLCVFFFILTVCKIMHVLFHFYLEQRAWWESEHDMRLYLRKHRVEIPHWDE